MHTPLYSRGVSPVPDITRMSPDLPKDINATVAHALAEDIGDGDRNAVIVSEHTQARARVLAKEPGVLAGAAWFNEVFHQLDANAAVQWQCADGDKFRADQTLCELSGSARALLSGERTALNFLQMLSGVATNTRRYVERVKGSKASILDTRKTLPGLRSAQKYAVLCGGGKNHRFGLYDAILIKENHIAAAGSIAAAVAQARANSPDLPLQVEVENLGELEQVLNLEVDSVLLDNFESHILARAVNMVRSHRRRFREQVLVEASGDITLQNVREVADNEVDRISIGGLTKHITAIDLSMRIKTDA